MSTEVHVRVLTGVKAEHVRVYFAEVDPDLLCILPFVHLLILVLVKANLGTVHVESDDASVWVALRVAEVHRLVLCLLARVVSDVCAPVHTFLGLLVVIIVILLVLICVKQWLGHNVLVVFLGVQVALRIITFIVML